MPREYSRKLAIDYAQKWAYDRNPRYYNYDKIGGDCTNFISQCIYAGSKIMNYTPNLGWYYNNANDKSPSWTGVEYLYNFLTRKKGIGPIGTSVSRENIQEGDVIQLAFQDNIYAHTLLITKKENNTIFVASHTIDNFNKNLELYTYKSIRYIHIEKIIT